MHKNAKSVNEHKKYGDVFFNSADNVLEMATLNLAMDDIVNGLFVIYFKKI